MMPALKKIFESKKFALPRIFTNTIIVALLLFALAFRITGDFAHEIFGSFACAFFSVHNIAKRRWYFGILKGKHSFKRLFCAFLNFALLFAFVLLVASGIFSSKYLFAFLGADSGMTIRQIHSTSAYWLLALVGAHLGMHWKFFKFREKKHHFKIFVKTAEAAIFILGIWACAERAMFEKLFLGYSFDYWNEELPDALFFAQNLAVIAFFGISTRLIFQFGDKIKNKINK